MKTGGSLRQGRDVPSPFGPKGEGNTPGLDPESPHQSSPANDNPSRVGGHARDERRGNRATPCYSTANPPQAEGVTASVAAPLEDKDRARLEPGDKTAHLPGRARLLIHVTTSHKKAGPEPRAKGLPRVRRPNAHLKWKTRTQQIVKDRVHQDGSPAAIPSGRGENNDLVKDCNAPKREKNRGCLGPVLL